MPRARTKRSLTKKIEVFCEGETERNYVEGMRQWLKERNPTVEMIIESKLLKGGGYSSALKALRCAPDSNCVARVAILDFDRWNKHPGERRTFGDLLELSRASSRRNVPVILVISNRNFEYAICCHDDTYKDGDTAAFLRDVLGYSDVSKCKSDAGLWGKLHRDGRSHDVALRHLSRRPSLIRNSISISRKTPAVSLQKVDFFEDESASCSSNLGDLFKVVSL